MSIAAAAWRMAIGCILENYVTCLLEWVGEALAGGIPGRQADDILDQFELDLEGLLDGDSQCLD